MAQPSAHEHPHGSSSLGVALLLNVSFTLIEVAGGLWTNSVAILSDALHDLGDSLSLLMAWYFQKLSQNGRTNTFTFGYKRFNTLGALITGLVLVVGSVIVIYEAIHRLRQPEAVKVEGMIALAVLGVVVNGLAAWRVWRSGRTLNEEMVAWHLFEDVAGWVTVLAGSIAMYFLGWYWLDAALSLGITLFILVNVVRRLGKALRIFLQAAPDEVNLQQLREAVCSVPGIRDVHHLHLWSLDGNYHIATFHAVVAPELPARALCQLREELEQRLRWLGIAHLTVEFEAEGAPCREEGL